MPPETRRVLFLAWQGARAGIERHLGVLLDVLPERFDKAVAFLSRGGPMADEIASRGVPTSVLGMRRSYDLRGALRVLHLVREGGFALVHDHSTMSAATMLLLGLSRVPLVVTEHLSFGQRRLDQRLSYRLLSRFVSCFIANSQATRAELIAHGVSASRVQVIPHGIPLRDGSPPEQARRAIAVALARGSGRVDAWSGPIVGFVGRLEPEKGGRQFVATAACVARAVPEARFVMIGDGSQRGSIEADAREAGLGDRLVMLGDVAEVERFYPAFAVLVSTSLRETFGLAILEAMAAGVPVAAFRTGGVGELLEAGAGEGVSVGDVRGLAEVVVELLRDPARRSSLARRARQRVSEQFTATRMAHEVARVYDDVLCARGR
jgi:glycosyltransferase involved in cell wall biosynthesis